MSRFAPRLLLAAGALSLALAAVPAQAENGRNGAAALGAAGGLAAGLLLGGAIANQPPAGPPPETVYVRPAPRRVYVEEPPPPVCHREWRREWTEGFGWSRRRVEVCE
jgi:hypothetical protein